MDTNYFVCTLGQSAALQEEPKPYRTISELLSYQSKKCGSNPAVGFPIPRQGSDWDHKLLTFQDIDSGTHVFAQRLAKVSQPTKGAHQTVALLCHSSPEFLFTWLGLIRLGHSVFLIAPQCQPGAILHLCKSCDISLLLHDEAHSSRATEVVNLGKDEGLTALTQGPIPLSADEEIFEVIHERYTQSLPHPKVDERDIAYLHHTSGTSSGLPKPIPQSHRAAIVVLPQLIDNPSKATFTTTPLYHGGIADVFRAWTSDALIWLFPGKDVPITARNICKSLGVTTPTSPGEHRPEVKYFSSVPYILQMMEADEAGLQALKAMDIVGVGGAALPAEVGKRLVDQGVKLISRFGSAECGFLLSSYRDFALDNDWQYLRNYNPTKLIDFESQDDGLSELVVKVGWPHMAKSNREDGSLATADLFARHPEIENAWLYHSRADSQLTLITGKKFDPAPLEDAIATSPHLSDVLIFGNGRPYPGALLLRSERSKEISGEELLQTIWPIVEGLNHESQDHARISKNMLVPVPHQIETLEKSSKGTIIRKAADERFADLVDAAYDTKDNKVEKTVDDENLPQHLIGLIQAIASNSAPLEEDDDLFSYGVDSIICMQLRNRLRHLTPNYNKELPLSVVEDCGTVRGLTNYILRKRHGAPDGDFEDEEQLMLDLVKEYGSFGAHNSVAQPGTNGNLPKDTSGQVVVLTGATGALGAHILDLLRHSDAVSVIYCLVRGANETAAQGRVEKALEQRGLMNLSSKNKLNEKVKVVHAQLSDQRLGLPDGVYDYLATEADLILHVAWTVNFRLKLRSFAKDNIAGVRNLIDLALAAGREQPPRFSYCSSTAAIMNSQVNRQGLLPEAISHDPSSASPLGYSRSKWVAEQICSEAHRHTALQGRVAVVRVGQLSGDSQSGVWNTKEAWPMMLSTVRLINCLPDLGDEPLDWLPVDIAAKAFMQAAREAEDDREQVPVYHVLNPYQRPTWHDMLQWIKKGERFDSVSPVEWVRRLEHSGNSEHSAMKLLGLWKESYCGATQGTTARPQFSIADTQRRVPALRDIRPLDEAYIGKIWDWVYANVH